MKEYSGPFGGGCSGNGAAEKANQDLRQTYSSISTSVVNTCVLRFRTNTNLRLKNLKVLTED